MFSQNSRAVKHTTNQITLIIRCVFQAVVDAGIVDEKVWPNLFLVGSQRTGTTTLYNILKKIPGIYFPDIKEPGYFYYGLEAHRLLYSLGGMWRGGGDRETTASFRHECTSDPSCIEFIKQHLPLNSVMPDRNEYLSLYDDASDEKMRGDASTSYFFNPASCKLIHKMSPRAKILVTLRDPVERIFSQYLQRIPAQEIGLIRKKTFRQYVDIHTRPDPPSPRIEWSASGYSGFLKDWFGTFGRRNVRVVIFEEFVRDQQNTVADILKWLGLDHAVGSFEPRHYNMSVRPRSLLASAACAFYMRKRAAMLSCTPVKQNDSGLRRGTYNTMRFGAPAKSTNRDSLRDVRTDLHRIMPFLLRCVRRILFKPGKPEMGSQDRALLFDLFRDDVQEIEGILGRKMPWKNFM